MKFSFYHLLRKYLGLMTFLLIATQGFSQKADSSAHKTHQWGIRSEVVYYNGGYNSMDLNTLAVECKSARHDFYVGLASPVFYYNSIAYGGVSGISGYQFYPFKQRKIFNAYGFVSANFGRHISNTHTYGFIQSDGTFVTSPYKLTSTYVRATLGAGFDIGLGKHFFSNFSMGIFNVQASYNYRYENPEAPSGRDHYSHIGLDTRIGIGYRW